MSCFPCQDDLRLRHGKSRQGSCLASMWAHNTANQEANPASSGSISITPAELQYQARRWHAAFRAGSLKSSDHRSRLAHPADPTYASGDFFQYPARAAASMKGVDRGRNRCSFPPRSPSDRNHRDMRWRAMKEPRNWVPTKLAPCYTQRHNPPVLPFLEVTSGPRIQIDPYHSPSRPTRMSEAELLHCTAPLHRPM